MVVAGGFEPPTPALSTRCSNQLSYATERDPTCCRLPILESRWHDADCLPESTGFWLSIGWKGRDARPRDLAPISYMPS